MTEPAGGPIVFISRSTVKPGAREALEAFLRRGAVELQKTKPQTVAFLPYLSASGTALTIVHVFADAEAMGVHIEGADTRSEAASAFIETTAIEIYGVPTAEIRAAMESLSGAGVTLEVWDALAGFLRTESGRDVRPPRGRPRPSP